MRTWLEAATASDDLEAACLRAGVPVSAIPRGRREDPQFDEACRVYDQVVDLKIADVLRSRCLDGNIPAQSLYFRRVRELVLGPPEAGRADPGDMPGGVAEAMVQAGLDFLVSSPHDAPGSPPGRSMPLPPSSRPGEPDCPRSRGGGASSR